MFKHYQAKQESAIGKLSVGESSALLGPLVAATSFAASQSDDDKTRRYLELVEKSYRELLDRLNRPLYFLGPNGEQWTEEEWHSYVYNELMD